MKIEIKMPRPRNPLIALARLRRAGSHRPSGRTERQCAPGGCAASWTN